MTAATPTSPPTRLALSRLTGRPVAATSAVAMSGDAAEVLQGSSALTAAYPPPAKVPAGLARILRPQAGARWILPQLSAITPTYIESVMRGAFAGGHLQMWELFDLMEDTWPRLAKNLNELKDAVLAMDWKLEPWAEEDEPPTESAQEKAKLISSAIWRMRPDPAGDENGFQQTLYDILDAWAKGTSVLEIHWEIRRAGTLGDITAPRASSWVHPVQYAWSNEGRLGLRSEMLGTDPGRYSMLTTSTTPGRNAIEDFPPDMFLIAIKKAKTGAALQTALLRSLAWWWCAANFSADWLMNLAQIFGLPIRWANYASGSSQATIDAISNMLENLGSAGWASFPEGTTLELKDAGNLGTMSPQGDLLDRADKNCDLLILGQTLTSEVRDTGGALATAKVHEGVKGEKIAAAANFAAEVINCQLIPAILRQNYGDDEERPEMCAEPEKIEDVKANAERDAVLSAMGVELPKEWFYKRHNVPLPQPGEETISKPPPPPPAPGMPGAPGAEPGPSRVSRVSRANEPNEEEEPAQAKANRTAGPTPPSAVDLNRLASAMADDLKPLRDRLERILAIQDPEILKAKLGAMVQQLPSLLTDINADPESARVIEDAMFNGIVTNLRKK